jgi:hypothetical protein
MRKFNSLLLFAHLLYGCGNTMSIKEKFTSLSNLDYSKYNDTRIIIRNGVYFVTFHDLTYKIEKGYFNKKLDIIRWDINNNHKKIITKKDINHIENVVAFFDGLNILSLYVDKKGNVYLSVPWHDRCTYYFLKLSPSSTLLKISKQYYQYYEKEWYFDKECFN